MSKIVPDSDAVREVVDLLVTGNHVPNIRARHDADEVIAGALAYFADVASLDADVHKGMQIEMLRDLARRAAELGDFGAALKAVAQMSALTSGEQTKSTPREKKTGNNSQFLKIK